MTDRDWRIARRRAYEHRADALQRMASAHLRRANLLDVWGDADGAAEHRRAAADCGVQADAWLRRRVE